VRLKSVGFDAEVISAVKDLDELTKLLVRSVPVSRDDNMGEPISYRIQDLYNNPGKVALVNGYGKLECEEEPLAPDRFEVRLVDVCVKKALDYSGKDEVFFRLWVETENGEKVVKDVPKKQAIELEEDPTCNSNVSFSDSVIIDVPRRNGFCFYIKGDFHESEVFSSREFDVFEREHCFRDGEWSGPIDRQDELLRHGEARWRTVYWVEKKRSVASRRR